MPPTRREFLKSAAAVVGTGSLVGCDSAGELLPSNVQNPDGTSGTTGAGTTGTSGTTGTGTSGAGTSGTGTSGTSSTGTSGTTGTGSAGSTGTSGATGSGTSGGEASTGSSGTGTSGDGGSDGGTTPEPEPTHNTGVQPSSTFDYPTVTLLPFAHGVASGDPLQDRVIIWTRVTEETPSAAAIPVAWDVATDTAFTNIVKTGTQHAIAEHDWTVKVDVTGLNPATTYYYRFKALGFISIMGRTRTAPATAVDEIRLAVVSCSSYWSSYWDGYGHLANRNDIDLVIHCGDYIYDFVDSDEEVRARVTAEDIVKNNPNDVDYRDWQNLDEVRRRYALYRSDPHHCRAHQQHPWVITWDNHDIDPGGDANIDDTVRAFYEWTPTRPPNANNTGGFHLVEDGSYPTPPNPRLNWRQLHYGPLVDILCIDTQLLLREATGAGGPNDASNAHLPNGGVTHMGKTQFDWFTQAMLDSFNNGKTWRIIVNQSWMAPWGIPNIFPDAGSEMALGARWDEHPEERAVLFDYLRGSNPDNTRIRNNIVVTGDMHGNWASDLIEENTVLNPSYLPSGAVPVKPNPRQGSTTANAAAGFGRANTGNTALANLRADSVGSEFAPTSMGRGGADELIANMSGSTNHESNVQGTRAIETATMQGNKHVQFMEWVDHGYGIVHITAEKTLYEFWWQDKLTQGADDTLGFQMVSWSAQDNTAVPAPRQQDQIDDVLLHGMAVAETSGSRVADPALEGTLNPA